MLRILIPAGLGALLVAVIGVLAVSGHRSRSPSSSATSAAATLRKLPPYWIVRRGETYAQIAQKTGLRVDQLKALNPDTDPRNLLPGERLQLAPQPPPPPNHLGPGFWTVRSGQSFGSIAAKTRQSIVTLEQLNPGLKPSELQPGDRVRLRP